MIRFVPSADSKIIDLWCRPAIICALLAAAVAGVAVGCNACGSFEKTTHYRFAIDVKVASDAVQQVRKRTGNLPVTLEHSDFELPPTPVQRLIQYRLEDGERYLLWIHRDDLEGLESLDDATTPTVAPPVAGDIFARFDTEGNVILASWRCTECSP